MSFNVLQFAIYMATIDYMVAAYGPYAASATGGNGFARDFLAGIAAMYSVPRKPSLPSPPPPSLYQINPNEIVYSRRFFSFFLSF